MMEDGPFTPNSMLGTDNSMDLDLINELLYDGYWLHTAEGSEFWQPALSSPSALNFSSSFVPASETKTNDLNPLPFKEGSERLGFGSYPPSLEFPRMDELSGSQTQNHQGGVNLAAPSSGLSENFALKNTEMNRTFWVSPIANAAPVSTLEDRLKKAITHLRETTKDGDVLIQIWVPVKKGGKRILTTDAQPYSVTSNSKSLEQYRTVSKTYEFAADENSKDLVGLPGRVFLNKLPEWTPDVRFFKTEEYPRVSYAHQLNVCGSLALPVFERGSGSCLGVVEIVTTTQRVNYRPELESVCRALEAVSLRSSDILSPPTFKGCDDSYQAVLVEIREVLKSVCDAHGLPLAQTWAPCCEQSKAGSRHSDENYTNCVSTVDSACYVTDPQVKAFHDACSEHHLIRGEGVVGGAFMTNQPCFASDITALTKTEYPLSHHARIFKLHAAVAIRLRSVYTGTADFVLEFFLPSECRDGQEQRHMLGSLSAVIQQVGRSLRVVTDQEIAEERSISERLMMSSIPKESSPEESSWVAQMAEAQQKGKAVAAPLGYEKVEPEEEFQPTAHWENAEREFHQDSKAKASADGGGDFSSFGGSHLSGVRKAGEKRRTKTEKTISMDVLRQYFAGSLKDAAKSIGVCPTTLKRICRQHGITRWPSRKIKKVGHSLKKLQLVIDSVQGVEGSIQLSSFYSKFPELSSPGFPGTNSGSMSTVNDQSRQFNAHADGTSLLSPATNASKSPSSSCSHSSSSSFSCPLEAKPPPGTVHVPGGDASLAEQQGLKRAHSENELLDSGQEETKLLVRSQSHKFFNEGPVLPEAQAQALMTKPGTQVIQGAGFRVKVIFGEENIRFKIPENYGFGDVQHEIGKRFNIDDTGKIDLKYLDDDNEWVLLTCDADLEECIDIHRTSRSRTIKLSVHQASNAHLGSSFGSNGLS